MKKTSVLKRLLSFIKPYSGYLIFALVCAVISVTLSLLAPILIGNAIDQIVAPGQVYFPKILRILIYLVCTVLVSALFQWFMKLAANKISYNTVRDLREAAFRQLNRVPLKYIDGHPHGDILSRVINDVDQISDGLIQGFTQFFTGIITIVGTLVFMLTINGYITLAVVLITPLSLFVAYFIAKHSHKMFQAQSVAKGELSSCVEELIGSQKVVKAFRYEDDAQEKFQTINAKLYESGMKSQFLSSTTNPCTRFVNSIVFAAVGIMGALFTVSGFITVGNLSSFLAYANQYTKPFNEITGVVTELQTAFAAAQRVFALLDEPQEESDQAGETLRSPDGSVALADVDFSYRPDRPLIQNFNLDVSPGQRIAIVGPTGCGKTTLINLLMRFYDVTGGEIRTSGIPVRDLTRASLRGAYGMVLQESWLFAGSVRDNIAYGKPDATDAEVVAAAKAAHIHGFIERLPNGYDTLLGENGGNVSQGQKQLLCIARVMLTQPPMLILDEATSSIDTRTELQIQQAFAVMMQGRTSFVVAHRLSTIREADVILVMNDGNIIEQGTHTQLLARNGFYANLYNSQFSRG